MKFPRMTIELSSQISSQWQLRLVKSNEIVYDEIYNELADQAQTMRTACGMEVHHSDEENA